MTTVSDINKSPNSVLKTIITAPLDTSRDTAPAAKKPNESEIIQKLEIVHELYSNGTLTAQDIKSTSNFWVIQQNRLNNPVNCDSVNGIELQNISKPESFFTHGEHKFLTPSKTGAIISEKQPKGHFISLPNNAGYFYPYSSARKSAKLSSRERAEIVTNLEQLIDKGRSIEFIVRKIEAISTYEALSKLQNITAKLKSVHSAAGDAFEIIYNQTGKGKKTILEEDGFIFVDAQEADTLSKTPEQNIRQNFIDTLKATASDYVVNRHRNMSKNQSASIPSNFDFFLTTLTVLCANTPDMNDLEFLEYMDKEIQKLSDTEL